MSRGTGVRVFLFSWESLKGVSWKIFSSKAVVNLNMKFISKLIFTNRGSLHCASLKVLYCFKEKRAYKARDMLFFLQNVQNLIFKIWKMFKTTRNSPWKPVELTQK